MCYALERMTDPADRTALISEMRWGTDYLLRVENSTAGWFAYMPDNPRAPWVNKSAGTIGEIARALAAASVIYRDTDTDLCRSMPGSGRTAWAWIEANPNEFQRGLISTGWCGYTGNVLGAAVELARATGLQKYKNYATRKFRTASTPTRADGSSKTSPSVKFPGQADGWFGLDNDAYTGKSVIALCRFYPIADAATKETIEELCRQYVDAINNNTNNPYSAWSKSFL
jgi:hypothetical protein